MTQEALKLALEALYPIAHNTTDDPRAFETPDQCYVAYMEIICGVRS